MDKLIEVMAVMVEDDRGKVMNFYEASMPEEFGKMGIEVDKAGSERMVQERVKKMEKRRKVELIKKATRRMYSQARSGRGDAGWRLAEVCMKDASGAEWSLALGKVKMKMWKCFKFFLRRLFDLERAMEKEGRPEETVKITRVEMGDTFLEEMVCEEMKVVEEYREGAKQKVRSADVENEHETREERSKEDQQEWVKLKEEKTAVQEQSRQRGEE